MGGEETEKEKIIPARSREVEGSAKRWSTERSLTSCKVVLCSTGTTKMSKSQHDVATCMSRPEVACIEYLMARFYSTPFLQLER